MIRFILKVQLRGLVDRLNVGYERKSRKKSNSKTVGLESSSNDGRKSTVRGV